MMARDKEELEKALKELRGAWSAFVEPITLALDKILEKIKIFVQSD